MNKSLVMVDAKEGNFRYRYLETIRQYALEKLLESPNPVDVRDRHLAYFMEYTRRAESVILRADCGAHGQPVLAFRVVVRE